MGHRHNSRVQPLTLSLSLWERGRPINGARRDSLSQGERAGVRGYDGNYGARGRGCAGGRLVPAHGRRRQGLVPAWRQAADPARDRAALGAGLATGDQREWRCVAVRWAWPARDRRRHGGLRRAARGRARRHALGREGRTRGALHRDGGLRHALLSRRFGGEIPRQPPAAPIRPSFSPSPASVFNPCSAYGRWRWPAIWRMRSRPARAKCRHGPSSIRILSWSFQFQALAASRPIRSSMPIRRRNSPKPQPCFRVTVPYTEQHFNYIS